MKAILFRWCAPFVVAGCAFSTLAQEYTIVEIPRLGGPTNRALALNNVPQIVGTGLNFDFDDQAFLFSLPNTLTPLDETLGVAYGINDAGEIVAQGLGPRSYIRRTDGTLTPIPNQAGSFSSTVAFAIDSAGAVVGGSVIAGPNEFRQAFRWTGSGEPQNLGTLSGDTSVALGMNNTGWVVGTSRTATNQARAFLFRGAGPMEDIGGDVGGEAHAANDIGEVVGVAGGQAFHWQDGSLTLLGALPGPTASNAWGINSRSVIVGESNDRAFIYRAGTMIDLNSLVAPGSGWTLKVARAINEFGEVAGWGTLDGVDRAFLLVRTCIADYNQDGQIDFFDYLDFANDFGRDDLRADVNRDGQIDFFDYLDFADAFGRECE